MDDVALRRLLDALQVGAVTVDHAIDRLRRLPYADSRYEREVIERWGTVPEERKQRGHVPSVIDPPTARRLPGRGR